MLEVDKTDSGSAMDHRLTRLGFILQSWDIIVTHVLICLVIRFESLGCKQLHCPHSWGSDISPGMISGPGARPRNFFKIAQNKF